MKYKSILVLGNIHLALEQFWRTKFQNIIKSDSGSSQPGEVVLKGHLVEHKAPQTGSTAKALRPPSAEPSQVREVSTAKQGEGCPEELGTPHPWKFPSPEEPVLSLQLTLQSLD